MEYFSYIILHQRNKLKEKGRGNSMPKMTCFLSCSEATVFEKKTVKKLGVMDFTATPWYAHTDPRLWYDGHFPLPSHFLYKLSAWHMNWAFKALEA